MSHAFPAAVAARDAEALIDTLAPDVTLHSAVTKVPFEGREVVADTYRSVIESFDELRIVDEFERGDTVAFFWEGRMGGRFVGGADRVRLDANGKVARDHGHGAAPVGHRHLPGRDRVPSGPPAPWRVVARLLRVTSLPLPSAPVGGRPARPLDRPLIRVSG